MEALPRVRIMRMRGRRGSWWRGCLGKRCSRPESLEPSVGIFFRYICKEIERTSVTKKDYIEYWTSTAAKDWKATQNLFKSKDYVHALFWSHLVLEKLCKANWVKHHQSNHPPKIHNLIYFVENVPLAVDASQRCIT